MVPKHIKWSLLVVPAAVILAFETIRHSLMEKILPMAIGNCLTTLIAAAVIAMISHRLFTAFAKTEHALGEERKMRAIMEERERLSRELHDRIAQSIFYAGVQIEVTKQAAMDSPEVVNQLDGVLLALQEVDDNVRQAILNLRQHTRDGLDFGERVRSFLTSAMADSGIEWRLETSQQTVFLSAAEQVQLFGILQESVTNIKKHAHASQVVVSLVGLKTGNGAWLFSIRDNGVGFDVQQLQRTRFGLNIISRRATEMGAVAQVISSASGTTVSVRKD